MFFGALSDYYGRKYIFLIGGACFCIVSMLCVHCASIESMILFRFFQAFSAGAFVNTANAIVRDVCKTQQETTLYLGILNGTLAFSPGLAPILGLGILHYFNWSGVFMFLILLAGVLMVMGLLIPETHADNGLSRGKTLANTFADYLVFFRYRHCVGYSVIYGLGFSSFIIYMTTSSWLWLHMMGQSSEGYTFYFSVYALAFACRCIRKHVFFVSDVVAQCRSLRPSWNINILKLLP